MAIYNLWTGNGLHFIQSIDSNIKAGYARNVLKLFQDIETNVHIIHIGQTLVLNQALGTANVLNHSANNKLWLDHVAAKVIPVSVNHYLLFLQSAILNPGYADNEIIFVQNADYSLCRAGSNILAFDSNADHNIVKIENLAQELIMESGVVGFTNSPLVILIPIPDPIPSKMTFSYGSSVLQLPAPDFDNSNGLNFDRANAVTRGGDLVIYRDSTWPVTETFIFKWTALDQKQVNAFLNFLRGSNGQAISVTDFEGRSFSIIITKPEGETSQITLTRYTATLEYIIA